MIRFILRPRSPWGTPLRGDTLCGLLLTRIAEEDGIDALRQTLRAFREGEAPFVLSSAMPAETVFAPCLPPICRADFYQMIVEKSFVDASGRPLDMEEALQHYKKFRKRAFLPLKTWQTYASCLSTADLFADFCAVKQEPFTHSRLGQEPHVTIHRRTGAALTGGLFHNRLQYFENEASLHVYAHAKQPQILLERLQRIGLLGFGKDASTGKGRFDVVMDTDFVSSPKNDCPWHLLLSPCAAPVMRSIAGWYGVEMKRGKASAYVSRGRPFKNPFLCLKEGAVLSALPSGPYVLDDIHAHEDIVQVIPPLTLTCALAKEAPHA